MKFYEFQSVIGDVFSGKTSFIKLVSTNKPQLEYKETKACSTTQWKYSNNNESHVVSLVDTPGFAQSYPREVICFISFSPFITKKILGGICSLGSLLCPHFPFKI